MVPLNLNLSLVEEDLKVIISFNFLYLKSKSLLINLNFKIPSKSLLFRLFITFSILMFGLFKFKIISLLFGSL